jgi:hypothetical protein
MAKTSAASSEWLWPYSLLIYHISIKSYLTYSLPKDSSSKAVTLFQKFNIAYRCIKLGENRSLLADLLWIQAQKLIKSYETGNSTTA